MSKSNSRNHPFRRTRLAVATLAAPLAFSFAAPAHADCSADAELRAKTKFAASQPASTAPGVEREMKESGEQGGAQTAPLASNAPRQSGEKGGTQDINIGVGELQECAVLKN